VFSDKSKAMMRNVDMLSQQMEMVQVLSQQASLAE
jgi:hypothetical protein